MVWRCGTEDETTRTISTYISIQSLINADNIFDFITGFVDGYISCLEMNGWNE